MGSDETPSSVPRIVATPPGPRSREILERQAKVLYRGTAGDVGPFVITRKSGYEIEDIDGNVFLDCISAMASVPVGAARADITDAAVEALRRYGNEDTHYYSHEYVLPLAERLVAIAPGALGQDPSPAPPPEPAPSGLEEQVTVCLTEVEILATDKKGQPLRDLTVDEIEIRENGRARKVAFVESFGTASLAA